LPDLFVLLLLQDLLALSIAMEHPTLSTVRALFTIASTCRAWRHAVQQYAACNIAVTFNSKDTLQRLQSFSLWLPKYAPLVRSISVVDARAKGRIQLLQQTIQKAAGLLCGDEPEAPAAGAAAATRLVPPPPLQQQQQQQKSRLRLASFSSDSLCDASMVAALPAHSRTQLILDVGPEDAFDGAALSAALAHLSSLQQLWLTNKSSFSSSNTPGSCLAGIAQLSRLTCLGLDGYWPEVQQPLQRLLVQLPQLQQLHVHLWSSYEQDEYVLRLQPCLQWQLPCEELPLPRRTRQSYVLEVPHLELSPLTQLTDLSTTSKLHDSTDLPLQLRQLQLGECSSNSNIAAVLRLQHLQCLSLLRVDEHPGDLQLLPHLSKLTVFTHLALQYHNGSVAARTASAWAQLPQLRELRVATFDASNEQQVLTFLSGVAAVTGLTKLQLQPQERRSPTMGWLPEGRAYAVCASLGGLTRLVDLRIALPPVVERSDALALTALTALTRLCLSDSNPTWEPGVGTSAAAALCCHLKQLQHLEVEHCNILLDDEPFLEALGQLTQLTQLQLSHNGYLTEYGLMMLAGLTNLQATQFSMNSQATRDRFWEALRCQQ
jgi:hypothetical protein